MAPIDDKGQYDGGGCQDSDRSMPLIKITFEWVREILGMVLIAELLLTFLCACCASTTTSWSGTGCAGRMGFLDFVAWTAFLNILIVMIIRVLGLWERLLWICRHPAVALALSSLAVFGFLIGSSLAASCAKPELTYNTSTTTAAAVFGFFCLILFAFEAFLHFQRYRKMESEGRRQTSSDEAKGDVI